MFLDVNNFSFLNDLCDNKRIIFSEFENAKLAETNFDYFLNSDKPEFTNHTKFWLKENNLDAEETGYDLRNGIWGAFPLYKKSFPITWYPVNKVFPYLSNLFASVSEIEFACFMRLEAGKSVDLHSHSRQHLIFHMLMNNLDEQGCELTCAEEKKKLLHRGDALLFDYSLPHSSYNSSNYDRINLVIDFKL